MTTIAPTHYDYPDDFIEDVRKEFSGHKDIIEALDAGLLMGLGNLLHRERMFDGSASRVSQMLYNGFVKELQREATKAARRETIYSKWYGIYQEAKAAHAGQAQKQAASSVVAVQESTGLDRIDVVDDDIPYGYPASTIPLFPGLMLDDPDDVPGFD